MRWRLYFRSLINEVRVISLIITQRNTSLSNTCTHTLIFYDFQDIDASTIEISSEHLTGVYSASFGADGDSETFFHTEGNDPQPWWKAELDGEFWISAVVITNRGTECALSDECCNA